MKRALRAMRGVTLAEMILVTAMIAIMVTAMSSLIIVVQKSYASMEAQSGIEAGSELALNRMMSTLTQSKRLFQNTTSDLTWVAAASLTGAPAALTGSKLPTIETAGSIAPTSANFCTGGTCVGNSLFFISVDSPTDMIVNNAAGSTVSVRIDAYHFNYYYLATDNTTGIGGQPRIMLWEWHSTSYVDYDELSNLEDGVLTHNVAAFLNSAAGGGYTYAVDLDTANVTAGIYTISGGNFSLVGSPSLPTKSAQAMLNILNGIISGGYAYGVSPNTSGTYNISYTVPTFATASGKFPSGFETMIVGANSSRQVFAQLILVAQGAFKGYKSQHQVVLATVRDLY